MFQTKKHFENELDTCFFEFKNCSNGTTDIYNDFIIDHQILKCYKDNYKCQTGFFVGEQWYSIKRANCEIVNLNGNKTVDECNDIKNEMPTRGINAGGWAVLSGVFLVILLIIAISNCK